MAALTALLVAAGAMSATGQIMSAQAQAAAGEEDARLKDLQADEVARLAGYKTTLMREDEQTMAGAQRAAAGASGGFGGSPLLALEDSHMKMEREVIEMNREAQFKESQLRAGAQMSSDLASDTSTAGWIKAGGIILGAAGSAYRQPTDKNSELDTGISGPGSMGTKFGGYFSSGSY